MRLILYSLFFLLAFVKVGGCQSTNSPGSDDDIFKRTVQAFRERTLDSISVVPFPSKQDSSRYVSGLFKLLNRELNTKIFDDVVSYSDFAFTSKSYNLSIHEIGFVKKPLKNMQESLRPVTEAPLMFKFVYIGNKLLMFSYSPAKANEQLNRAVDEFTIIYKGMTNSGGAVK